MSEQRMSLYYSTLVSVVILLLLTNIARAVRLSVCLWLKSSRLDPTRVASLSLWRGTLPTLKASHEKPASSHHSSPQR